MAVVIVAASCHDSTGPNGSGAGPVLASHADTIFAIGDTVRLTVGGSATDLVWQSRDPQVALVSQTGRVSGRSLGDAWVVVSRLGGGSDSARVSVRQHVATITVSPSAVSRPLRRTQQFQARGYDAQGVEVPNVKVTWSASGSSATIDPTTGIATANAVGTATISATVNDVSGTAVLTVSPLPALRFSVDTIDVGVGQLTSGQFPSPQVVADSIALDETFTASLSLASSAIASLSATAVPMPQGYSYHTSAPIQLLGQAAGMTQLEVSGGNYTDGTAIVRVSSPRLVIRGPTQWPSNGGTTNTYVVAPADSLGDWHYLPQPLVVRVRAATPGVILPADTTFTIGAGQGVSQVTVSRSAASGQTWLVASAPGYRSDSILVRVTGPALRFVRFDNSNIDSIGVGVDQFTDGNHFIYAGCCQPTDLAITITQRHPEVLRIPRSTLIPALDFSGRGTFSAAGVSPGTDTVIASAPGFLPDTLIVVVTTATYKLGTYPTTSTVGQAFDISALVGDTLGDVGYPVSAATSVVVTSSNLAILRPVSDTFVIGSSTGGGGTRINVVGPGSATLTLRDPSGSYRSVTTTPIAVAPTSLAITSSGLPTGSRSLGMRQLLDAVVQIRTGGMLLDSIQLRSSDPTIARPSVSALLLDFGGKGFSVVGGDRAGTAWIVASAPGVASDSIQVSVAKPTMSVAGPFGGTGVVGQSSLPFGGITLVLVDQNGNARVTSETLTFHLESSNPQVLVPDSEITVQAGAYSSNTANIKYVGAGTAIVRVIDPRAVPYAYDPGASPTIQVVVPTQP